MLCSCENEKFDPQSLILCINLPNHNLYKFLIYLNSCQMYSAMHVSVYVLKLLLWMVMHYAKPLEHSHVTWTVREIFHLNLKILLRDSIWHCEFQVSGSRKENLAMCLMRRLLCCWIYILYRCSGRGYCSTVCSYHNSRDRSGCYMCEEESWWSCSKIKQYEHEVCW